MKKNAEFEALMIFWRTKLTCNSRKKYATVLQDRYAIILFRALHQLGKTKFMEVNDRGDRISTKRKKEKEKNK